MSLTGRVHCHHNLVKHLGDWTQAGRFEVKARRGAVVLGLRSSGLPDGNVIRLGTDRAVLSLLVDDGTAVGHRNLRRTARGPIKHSRSPSAGGMAAGRRARLSGSATNSEIRIHRGGTAALSAMYSRAYVVLPRVRPGSAPRSAHESRGVPMIDDPSRGHQS